VKRAGYEDIKMQSWQEIGKMQSAGVMFSQWRNRMSAENDLNKYVKSSSRMVDRNCL